MDTGASMAAAAAAGVSSGERDIFPLPLSKALAPHNRANLLSSSCFAGRLLQPHIGHQSPTWDSGCNGECCHQSYPLWGCPSPSCPPFCPLSTSPYFETAYWQMVLGGKLVCYCCRAEGQHSTGGPSSPCAVNELYSLFMIPGSSAELQH